MVVLDSAPPVAIRGLRLWRHVANLTQRELAGRIGVCAQTISDWETGRASPRLVHLRRLQHILRAPSVDALFPDRETGDDAA